MASDRKAFATGTGTGRIGVVEVETLPFQATRELQGGIEQVKDTAQIRHNLDPVILKNLVIGLQLMIE